MSALLPDAPPNYLSQDRIVSTSWLEYRPRATTGGDELFGLVVDARMLSASWFNPMLDRMGELLTLQPDWDTYGGRAVRPDVAGRAMRFLAQVLQPSSRVPWLVPLSDGGLQIEWHRCGVDAEVMFLPTAEDEAFVVDQQTNTEWEGTAEAAVALLRGLVARFPEQDAE